MSTFLNVEGGGPDEVIDVATRVKSAGDDFAGTARSLVQAIEHIEAQRPWGAGDKYADAFLANYHGKSDAPMPTNEAVKKSLGDSGTSLSQIGTGVIEAMGKYQITDDDGATAIKSTQRNA